ncbi:MAG: peptide chain release factor N(5)-glutamine methyltransferase [Chlamydiales bacterium]|nr:peptide chain release factor N(5)-glutamine methyltransferase [Chlamydiales bacterium]NCF70678.1 peptide chain release factor N(5)-glutamine methyltransferase [Chlamydiales bacterium]
MNYSLNQALEVLQKALEPDYGVRSYHFSQQILESFITRLCLKKQQEDYQLDRKECTELEAYLSRIKSGEPFEYVLGRVDFFGTEICVTPAVLIPRQETEILAEMIVQELQKCSEHGQILVDFCTGSACLAISIKKALPHLKVIAIDISQEALTLAKKNAEHNQVEVEFIQLDLLNLQKFPFEIDYLVSNPPYLSGQDMKELSSKVGKFEPHLALAGGEDGLSFYKKFFETIGKSLIVNKKVYFEIGASQGDEIKKIFLDKGEIRKDWSGRDRFFLLEIE